MIMVVPFLIIKYITALLISIDVKYPNLQFNKCNYTDTEIIAKTFIAGAFKTTYYLSYNRDDESQTI